MDSITTYSSIADVNHHDWDLLSRDQVLMHRGWLQTIEQTYLGELSPNYLMLYEEGCPVVATVYRQINNPEDGHSFDHFLFGVLHPIFARIGISSLPMIASMSLRGYPVQFLVRPHRDPAKSQARRQAVLDTIHAYSHEVKMPVAFTKVVGDERETIRLLCRNGYTRIIGPPLAYLDIVWPSFSAYRKDRSSLSRNIRGNINWEINRNRKAGIEIVLLKNLSGYEEALYRLMALNASKYGQTNASYNDRFFYALAANMSHQYRVYAAFKKGTMVGMCLFLTQADVWHALIVGIDHRYEGNDLTYFNITFNRPIQDATNASCKRIYYGNSLYEVKLRRGCHLLPVNTFYKPYCWSRRMAAKPFFFLHRARSRSKRTAIVREHLKSEGD